MCGAIPSTSNNSNLSNENMIVYNNVVDKTDGFDGVSPSLSRKFSIDANSKTTTHNTISL